MLIPLRKATSPIGVRPMAGRGIGAVRAALSAQGEGSAPALRVPGAKYDLDTYDNCIYDGVDYALFDFGRYDSEVYQ